MSFAGNGFTIKTGSIVLSSFYLVIPLGFWVTGSLWHKNCFRDEGRGIPKFSSAKEFEEWEAERQSWGIKTHACPDGEKGSLGCHFELIPDV